MMLRVLACGFFFVGCIGSGEEKTKDRRLLGAWTTVSEDLSFYQETEFNSRGWSEERTVLNTNKSPLSETVITAKGEWYSTGSTLCVNSDFSSKEYEIDASLNRIKLIHEHTSPHSKGFGCNDYTIKSDSVFAWYFLGEWRTYRSK